MEQFKKELSEENIRIMHKVYDSFKMNNVSGWCMTAPNVFRKGYSMNFVKEIINSNSLGYRVEAGEDRLTMFFVYKK